MHKESENWKEMGKLMHAWATDLFPYCRSITGRGVRDTLRYFQGIHKDLRIHSVPTGTAVLDWTIPQEWEIHEGFIEGPDGVRHADFSNNNLHLVNYSAPIDKTVERSELENYVWTQPDQPQRIPYVTSYYKKRSGFCMSADSLEQLPEGKYRLFINSRHFDGELNMADLVIPGESSEEILISSYVCHPSMANNELSGPVLAMSLAKYIKDAIQNRKYTYRIVLVPETIGSIAYLSENILQMKKNVIAGFVLSCVGDDGAYTSIASRFGDTLADRAIRATLQSLAGYRSLDYLYRGSDERQYCSPGVDLPVVCFCRSRFGDFPEYHTDADNLDLISPAGLQGSFDRMRGIIDAFETDLYPRTKTLGEPQLGRRKLRPDVGQKQNYNDAMRLRMNLLSYADGATDIFRIAEIINEELPDVLRETRLLKEAGLLG